MKKLIKNICMFICYSLLCIISNNNAFAQDDSVVTEKQLKLHYVNSNNSLQYLLVETNLKTGKKIDPNKNVTVLLYLDSNKKTNLIGKIITDAEGKGKSFIPPSLKAAWDASSKHKFIAVPTYGAKVEESSTEIEITKTRMMLDTVSSDGVRSISVKVERNENDKWVPVKDVEMKIGVQRLGGILPAGETATYTTDSSGTARVDLKKDSLPGDVKGNLLLVAKVDDNELFGNLVVEKNVNWGVPTTIDTSFFNQRTLWTTRFKTPYWLLFMAYSIVIGVWGTLIYLLLQFFKIRRIGILKT